LGADEKGSFADYKGVWVFVEHRRGQAAEVSWELLGEGRRLAEELSTDLAAVVCGDGVEELAAEAAMYGADRVYLVDDGALADYTTAPYATATTWLIDKHRPSILLLGATAQGRDLASALATRVGTGLTADCTQLAIEEETGNLLQTRPAFGGNVMATIKCADHRPQMATVRPKVMSMPSRQPGRKGEIVREAPALEPEDNWTKLLEFIEASGEKEPLDSAEVIVAGGKGMGGADGFALLEELAGVLGGQVGSSRAPVSAGWVPKDMQVGQTGLTVRPTLYIACGISGAVQHLAGMQRSEVIVAINTDPEAPIFETADFGIVGDVRQVLPALTEALRDRLTKRGEANG